MVFLRVTLPHAAQPISWSLLRSVLVVFLSTYILLHFLIVLFICPFPQAQSIDIFLYLYPYPMPHPKLTFDYILLIAIFLEKMEYANNLPVFTHFLFTSHSSEIWVSLLLLPLGLFIFISEHMMLLLKLFYLEIPLASIALFFPGCLFLLP